MSTEIELKLQLTPRTAGKLAAHPRLAGIAPQKSRLLNTYYDTPRLDLHARRIAMRFRKKDWEWLLTVKSAEPACGGLAMRSEWESRATPGVFDFSHVDDDRLRGFLEGASEKLEPVFTTDFRRKIWRVPFGESLIELALDRGTIESQGKSTPICEIELELLSGKIDDIFGLTRQLQNKLDLHPAIASKAERGYNLFLNEPPRPFKAKPAPLDAAMTPVEAFRGIALGCLEHFQRNEAGLLDGNDPEFVHQARVALRRLRSAIKLFAPALPAEFVNTYGKTWKTLAGALGEARNWDVFLGETLPPISTAFPGNKDVRSLKTQAIQRAKAARHAIKGLLATSEYPRLLLEFTAATYALGDTLPIPLTELVQQQTGKHTAKAKKLARRHAELAPQERHKMRIAFKKLRYTLEFFGTLWPEKKLKPYLATLSKLQDELGLINDHLTAETLILAILGSRPQGLVHGWIAGRQALLISALPEAMQIWLTQNTP